MLEGWAEGCSDGGAVGVKLGALSEVTKVESTTETKVLGEKTARTVALTGTVSARKVASPCLINPAGSWKNVSSLSTAISSDCGREATRCMVHAMVSNAPEAVMSVHNKSASGAETWACLMIAPVILWIFSTARLVWLTFTASTIMNREVPEMASPLATL